jgi:hypothetical protein
MKPHRESRGVSADDDNPNICMLLANQIIRVTLIRKPTFFQKKKKKSELEQK